jgi:hypothetical protein
VSFETEGIEGSSVAFATVVSIVVPLPETDQISIASAISPAAAIAISVRIKFSFPSVYCWEGYRHKLVTRSDGHHINVESWGGVIWKTTFS